MEPVIENRRQFQRLNLKSTLRYQVRGTKEFDNAISDNISLGGLSLVNSRFLPPETVLMLEMNMFSRMFNFIAKVVWSRPLPHSDRYKLGVQFAEIDPVTKQQLSDFLKYKMQ